MRNLYKYITGFFVMCLMLSAQNVLATNNQEVDAVEESTNVMAITTTVGESEAIEEAVATTEGVIETEAVKEVATTDGVIEIEAVEEVATTEGMIETEAVKEPEKMNVKELILDHLADSYDWHIITIGDKNISVPLPVIVMGQNGWSIFMSSKFDHGHAEYKGFSISQSEKNKGKIVEFNSAGEEVRPTINISITKNVLAIWISCILLLCVIFGVAKWYRKQHKEKEFTAPKGFIGFMEMFIMSVVDDVIKPCVGKDYKRYTPYLLTAFFFIFFNNILGLIPIFPAGANVTGNIAITFILAMFTFFIVNAFGSKEYWKEIFWPDVPVLLKFPIPLMPIIELIGIFTKPLALMIRLFANILAGHSIVLGLVCLIFITAQMGAVINTSMTVVSVILSIFINLLEILVAYIQAYVFTMLSAVFIGLSRVEPHAKH